MVSSTTNKRQNYNLRLWKLIGLALLVIAYRASPSPATETRAERDGSHDFDWDMGLWKTHQKRRLNPLSGSNTWVEYQGTDAVHRIWDGANSGTIEADGTAGHLEIFTIRLYDVTAHQWSIYFATPGGGMSQPAVGEFINGRADFYDHEMYKGKYILLRFSVSDITPNSCHFEQAFSEDGGKTWEINFIVDETRA